ncbi:hypothetical protein [Pelagibacterium lentulum]|uniref:Uncharacterized protein n=1 Tax=Pelagibacterium lentulum TaxID=2029865 RepID=A0A916RQN4_9HYPH|nr:hypothetical protein [Pelagibacterium lentulum]GGA64642.1 hypothetical protein GCM10011499_38890 [Pelagibacterium lentulum]
MKFLICAIALVVLAGCSTSGTSSSVGGESISDGWQENEVKSAGMIYGGRPIGVRRSGVTPSGLSYTYHPDGSGSVDTGTGNLMGNWAVDCTRDRMTDRRECHIRSLEAKLLVEFGQSNTPQRVCIIGHNFPGRTGAIRVDSNSLVNTGTSGCVAGSFAQQMVAANRVTVRYVEWPYDYPRDHSALLRGYPEAAELLRFIRGNIDNLAF